MKIIDLLNKIANGNEAPKEIIYNGYNYLYHTDSKNYYRSLAGSYWISLTTDFSIYTILNDEVEILEEEKKIPDEININLAYIDKEYLLDKEDVDRKINEIINRHNILVDKVSDYIKSKGDE